jgi:probable toxin-antitoxin system toxin component, PIN family
LRAVLDANVLISALIRPAGPPGRILVRLLRDRAFELVASPATLDELRRSLRYPKVRKYLDLSETEIDLWVAALRAVAVVVEGRVSRHVVVADPADDIYLAAATDGLADYIISGDRHLLDLGTHEGVRILAPHNFLTLLEQLP